MRVYRIIDVHPQCPLHKYRAFILGLLGTVEDMAVHVMDEPSLNISDWYWYGNFKFLQPEIFPWGDGGQDITRDFIPTMGVRLEVVHE